MAKLTINSVIEELNGVIVFGIDGQEIDLTGTTYLEFAVMTEQLTNEELSPIIKAIVEEIGDNGLHNILSVVEEVMGEEDELEEVEDGLEEVSTIKPNTKPIVLEPIKMVNMDNSYTLDVEEFCKGIVGVSEICGRYTALINCGMSNEQAYELATVELLKAHEKEMIDKQIELKKLELDAQVRSGRVQQILSK